jgi:hypothetical protein
VRPCASFGTGELGTAKRDVFSFLVGKICSRAMGMDSSGVEFCGAFFGLGKIQQAVILSEAKNPSPFLCLYFDRREILRFAQNDKKLFSAACAVAGIERAADYCTGATLRINCRRLNFRSNRSQATPFYSGSR